MPAQEATLLFTGTFSGNITTGNVSLSSVGAYNLVMMSYDLDTADPIWGIQSYGAVLTRCVCGCPHLSMMDA